VPACSRSVLARVHETERDVPLRPLGRVRGTRRRRRNGYADPETGIGYGYVTNRMGTALQGDPRDLATVAFMALARGTSSSIVRFASEPLQRSNPSSLTRNG
jgi:hypothetical protein